MQLVKTEVATEPPRTLGSFELLAAASAFLTLFPFTLFGPGFVLDDWYTLRNASLRGWQHAATLEMWRARPGSGVVYTIEFGIIGARPAVIFALQMVVACTTAALLCRLVRHYLSDWTAFAVAALWVVLPNHTALAMWASAMPVAVALLLLVAGSMLIAERSPGERGALPIALLVAACLTYEAVAPMAVVVVLLLPRLSDGRIDRGFAESRTPFAGGNGTLARAQRSPRQAGRVANGEHRLGVAWAPVHRRVR